MMTTISITLKKYIDDFYFVCCEAKDNPIFQ
jgi:hypothetical protein